MTVKRMDNVAIVVNDIEGAIAFFKTLGLSLLGQMHVQGDWVDDVVGIDGVHSEIAMMGTPDGHSRIELTKYHAPALVKDGPDTAPPNTHGMSRIMFAVDDLHDTLKRLQPHGAKVVRKVVDYNGIYRLCYLRGPEGILVALAQELTPTANEDLGLQQ